MGAELAAPAIGAGASLIGGGKASKKASQAAGQARDAQMQDAAYKQMWGMQNQDRANDMNAQIQQRTNDLNTQNANATNAATQGNMSWANDRNIQNAQTAQEMNRANQDYAMGQNWESQLRGQQANQAGLDAQTNSNRLDSTNAFGGTVNFAPDGSVRQQLGAGDQALMNTYNQKANMLMQGMGGGFDVNGDVMNAYKAINQPLVDQQRDKENARLAAMGLGTGSGRAWGTAQDALNRNQVNSDQNAILQGFNADQALRSSNRADLGAMGGVRQGIQAGLAQPDYWKQGSYAGVTAPQMQAVNSSIGNVGGWSAPGVTSQAPFTGIQGSPTLNSGEAISYGNKVGQATQEGWNTMGKGLGDAASSIIGGKNNSGTQAGVINNLPEYLLRP